MWSGSRKSRAVPSKGSPGCSSARIHDNGMSREPCDVVYRALRRRIPSALLLVRPPLVDIDALFGAERALQCATSNKDADRKRASDQIHSAPTHGLLPLR